MFKDHPSRVIMPVVSQNTSQNPDYILKQLQLMKISGYKYGLSVLDIFSNNSQASVLYFGKFGL